MKKGGKILVAIEMGKEVFEDVWGDISILLLLLPLKIIFSLLYKT
jgi:hypothetical protein